MHPINRQQPVLRMTTSGLHVERHHAGSCRPMGIDRILVAYSIKGQAHRVR